MSDPATQASFVCGLHGFELFQGENQSDVDVNALGNHVGDGLATGGSGRDFDHGIWPVNRLPQTHCRCRCARRIMGQRGGDLKTDVALRTLGFGPERQKKIASGLDIGQDDSFKTDFRIAFCAAGGSNCRLIGSILTERLVKNGGIRG